MQTTSSIEIFRYWHRIRCNRSAPLRSDIRPDAIRHLLADLFILERDSRASARFRLAGTRICGLFGKELRGSAFDSLWSAGGMEHVSDIARQVMADHRPALLTASGVTGHGETLDVELVLMPLKSGDGPVDRIIGALVPLTKPIWIGAYPLPFVSLTGHSYLETGADLVDRLAGDLPIPASPALARGNPWSQAVRRVLHLSVLEGGRQV